MDCIDLVQDRHQWRALVNTVMDPRIPYSVGKFLKLTGWRHLHAVSYPCHVFVVLFGE
jgi:hypothetical protein